MNYQKLVIDNLIKFCPKNNPLSQEIAYSLLGNGKRFRGSLCYQVASIFDTDITLVHSSSCALEMIHVYSLIHDDLPAMDNDDIRHNQLTSHKKFGEATAILVGDSLQTLAFKIIIDDKNLTDSIKIQLLKILTNASFDMVLGQKLDIEITDSISIDELTKIHQLKTGALLKASVLMGSIIAGVNKNTMGLLVDFAHNLGLAYQVQDDTFDNIHVKTIGKSNNIKKITFVDLLGIESAINYYKSLYNSALTGLIEIDNSQELYQLVLEIKDRKF